MFEKVSQSYDSMYIYMDTNTDHFSPLALHVQGKNMKHQDPLPISNGNHVDDLQPYLSTWKTINEQLWIVYDVSEKLVVIQGFHERDNDGCSRKWRHSTVNKMNSLMLVLWKCHNKSCWVFFHRNILSCLEFICP